MSSVVMMYGLEIDFFVISFASPMVHRWSILVSRSSIFHIIILVASLSHVKYYRCVTKAANQRLPPTPNLASSHILKPRLTCFFGSLPFTVPSFLLILWSKMQYDVFCAFPCIWVASVISASA